VAPVLLLDFDTYFLENLVVSFFGLVGPTPYSTFSIDIGLIVA